MSLCPKCGEEEVITRKGNFRFVACGCGKGKKQKNLSREKPAKALETESLPAPTPERVISKEEPRKRGLFGGHPFGN